MKRTEYIKMGIENSNAADMFCKQHCKKDKKRQSIEHWNFLDTYYLVMELNSSRLFI